MFIMNLTKSFKDEIDNKKAVQMVDFRMNAKNH